MKSVSSSAVLSLLLVLPLAAAAGEPPMKESANQSLPPPAADKAQIVFLEPANAIAGAFLNGVYELDGDQRKLLAITGPHSKVALDFSPGHHRLASNSGLFAHVMDVDVEAGKTYYVLMRFIYSRGFQLRPLRTSGTSDYSVTSPKFNEWVSSTHFVEMTPRGIELFEGGRLAKNVAKSEAKALEEWDRKTPEEHAELTLTPQDAVAPATQAAPAAAASL
jgi:hypothetical protein